VTDQFVFNDLPVPMMKMQVHGPALRKSANATVDDSANAPDTLSCEGFVAPYSSPTIWHDRIQNNTRGKKALEFIARNAVGRGAYARMNDTVKRTAKGRRNAEAAAVRDVETLQNFLARPNNKFIPFSEVCFKVEFDFQVTGNGFLEVVEYDRAAGNRPVALFHAPCRNIRVHRSGDTYARSLQNSVVSKIYFRRFGDTDPDHKFIDRQTGKFYAEWPSELDDTRRGSALLHFVQYCPFDDFYGQSTLGTAASAIVGNAISAAWNNNLIQNSVQIALAILVEGGNLAPDSMEMIQVVSSADGAGPNNAGRLLTLQPDLSSGGLTGGETKIKLQEIKLIEDASFPKFREMNDDEVQDAAGMSNALMGRATPAGRSGASAKQVTLEQVIEPRTRFWEQVLVWAIFSRIAPAADVRFRRVNALDPLQEASLIQKLKDALTPNEVRERLRDLLENDRIENVSEEWANTTFGRLAELAAAVDSTAVSERPVATTRLAILSGEAKHLTLMDNAT